MMSGQAETLLEIAEKLYKTKMKLVGVPIEGERNEKFELYHSYPIDKCEWIENNFQSHWDIPKYSSGSTRHAKCLFLLPGMAVGDAERPYRIRNNDDMEDRFKEDERYDREKVLVHERSCHTRNDSRMSLLQEIRN